MARVKLSFHTNGFVTLSDVVNTIALRLVDFSAGQFEEIR
ncbi:hypothetical protein BTN50_0337 [Candidatus Enterovibrio altilux]|uniref:Uncharacterized protein n=1 Tax=Candidatus Enterovibrio altilux TaxID=1927128 RepID=A0A291B7A6_9GAMM|nr:hypothetical protein BTN50_0337 [Candidatus Enterovibrio luxaltus]